MSERRLVLLRHGQTAWNATGRGQGHTDVELDETGHAQAALVAPSVAGYAPAALWSSDLARARQTAAYVGKETGLEAVLDPRLREIDLGPRTGLSLAEFRERFPEEYAAFRAGSYVAVPGGETTESVHGRIVPALTALLSATPPGATAVAVSHGAALKVAVAGLLGLGPEGAGVLRGLGNCRWAVLEESEGGGRLRLGGYDLAAPEPDPGPDFASGQPVG